MRVASSMVVKSEVLVRVLAVFIGRFFSTVCIDLQLFEVLVLGLLFLQAFDITLVALASSTLSPADDERTRHGVKLTLVLVFRKSTSPEAKFEATFLLHVLETGHLLFSQGFKHLCPTNGRLMR
jgi:hypothetical protein